MDEYLQTVGSEEHRTRLRELFNWIQRSFPGLEYKTAWKQPMFTDHGTYIIGFSVARGHLSVAPEAKAMERFSREIEECGYTQTSNLFRIKWDTPIDYELLARIINYNISDKSECDTFWRRADCSDA